VLCRYWLGDKKGIQPVKISQRQSPKIYEKLMRNQPNLEQVVREAATICPRHNIPLPCKLTFDLLTLKVVSE